MAGQVTDPGGVDHASGGVPGGGYRSVRQHTLKASVSVTGAGLMLGQSATVIIEPAPPGHGIIIERIDLDPPVRIPALVEHAVDRARRSIPIGARSPAVVEGIGSAAAGLGAEGANGRQKAGPS